MNACVRVAWVLFLCLLLGLLVEETEGFIGAGIESSSKPNTILPQPNIVSKPSTNKDCKHSLARVALFANNENDSQTETETKPPTPTPETKPPTPTTPTRTTRIEAMSTTSVPLASYFLVFVTVRSARQLLTLPTEIPGNLFFGSGQSIDYLGTAFDVFFVLFGIQQLLQQNGIAMASEQFSSSSSTGDALSKSFANTQARILLDVGREPGTMMEKEWASSGARLLLPVNLEFTDQPVKIDFPGEESLGGRFANRLDILDDKVTFVGPSGEVTVPVSGGAWAGLPITEPYADKSGGAFKLRFFLDFPSGAQKNDVSLPQGRIFFSGVGFSSRGSVADTVGESVVPVSSTSGLLKDGRLTYKRNGPLNFWGSFGDTNAILGKYRVDSARTKNEDEF